ncbi:hypothetical protein [Methylobacterium oryzisoli]|uniref:hypothetical protein n=1 Tax=Methylobacterium oryzisoli TaxID=3385502 RepID=UPI00389223BB
MTKHTPPLSPEIRERAIRTVRAHQRKHDPRLVVIQSIAGKLGRSGETLPIWNCQTERNQGLRLGQTTDKRERIKALERANRELPLANEIRRKASAQFCGGGAQSPVKDMIAFIVCHRAVSRGALICRALPIASSANQAHRARRADTGQLLARVGSDETPMVEVRCVYDANFGVNYVRQVWIPFGRDGLAVARCTVAHPMRAMNLKGILRRQWVRISIPDPARLRECSC